MPLILIVDDDRDAVALLELALARYTTIFASDGESALHQLATEKPDLVLMDLVMGGMDGATLLPRIREVSEVPLIVLSGRAGQSDVVPALRQGADDFIVKPFDLADLEARIEAVLRRSPKAEPHIGTLTVSGARGARVNGKILHLTPSEHRLLTALVARPGEAVSRDELAEQIFDVVDATTPNMVDQHVLRLRRRLAQVDGAPVIMSVRGQGYRIADPADM